MKSNFKEKTRIWVDYEDVYEHAKSLFLDIKAKSGESIILIAVGRGGWIPTRILCSFFDQYSIKTSAYTVISNYKNLGSIKEKPIIVQSLDKIAVSKISSEINDGAEIWMIDGPFLTGRTINMAAENVRNLFNENGLNPTIRIAALELVRYKKCKEAPWRKQAKYLPDAWGKKYTVEEKPYVEYPWEYNKLWK